MRDQGELGEAVVGLAEALLGVVPARHGLLELGDERVELRLRQLRRRELLLALRLELPQVPGHAAHVDQPRRVAAAEEREQAPRQAHRAPIVDSERRACAVGALRTRSPAQEKMKKTKRVSGGYESRKENTHTGTSIQTKRDGIPHGDRASRGLGVARDRSAHGRASDRPP